MAQWQDVKWSAIFYAQENGHNGVTKLLLEYGADEKLIDKVRVSNVQNSIHMYCVYRKTGLLRT